MTRPGWTTFPIRPIAANGSCSCRDPECHDAGKHPAVPWGAKSLAGGTALPIPAGYGVGLACGERSGVVVLDLDRKNGLDGLAALQALAANSGGTVPETLCSLTPSGGYHLFFEWPGFVVKNSASTLGPGIDVRGDGGYVVLPPSPHKCGGRYEYLDPDIAIAPCPEWLRAVLLRPPKTARRVTRGIFEKLAKRWLRAKGLGTQELGASLVSVTKGEPFAEQGERDTVLFKLCRELAREIPDADPGSVADLFTSSLDAMPGGPSVEGVVEKFTRAVADLGGVGRPEVYITDDLARMTDAAEVAVARGADIYVSGGVLVRATPSGVTAVPRAALREAVSRGAKWLRGEKADFPPAEIVDALGARSEWPSLRTLNGMTEVPLLRPDGSVLDAPGYDAATGVLYHPKRPGPKVGVGLGDARRALSTLVDVVSQFSWEKPEHLTGWLAAVLTPLTRNAYDGAAPLFLFDASTAGSGKSLLAKLAAVIGTGSVGPASPWPSDEEERRKAITTYALEGCRVVCWDNVTGKLGGKTLCAALTEPVWRDRVLGSSKQWSGRMGITFYATANNVQLGADMDRRVVHVRLAPQVESPERRTGWRHPDLLGYVREHQPELTAAALTILHAYQQSGMKAGVDQWGSYESWTERVVEALVWCGLSDLGRGRDEAAEADPDRELMRVMVREWGKVFPKGAHAREAIDRIWPMRSFEKPFPALAESIESLLALGEGGRPTPRVLGELLRRMRGRVFNGGAHLSRIVDRNGIAVWSAGCAGS